MQAKLVLKATKIVCAIPLIMVHVDYSHAGSDSSSEGDYAIFLDQHLIIR